MSQQYQKQKDKWKKQGYNDCLKEVETILDEMLKFRGRYIEVEEIKQKLQEMKNENN